MALIGMAGKLSYRCILLSQLDLVVFDGGCLSGVCWTKDSEIVLYVLECAHDILSLEAADIIDATFYKLPRDKRISRRGGTIYGWVVCRDGR